VHDGPHCFDDVLAKSHSTFITFAEDQIKSSTEKKTKKLGPEFGLG
jgi:hypothetical protein